MSGYFRLVKSIDIAFEIFVLFLIVFVWARFFIRSILWAVGVSILVTIILCILLSKIRETKLNKKLLTKNQQKKAQAIADFLMCNNYEKVLSFFEGRFSAKVLKNGLMEIQGKLCFLYNQKSILSSDDMLNIIKIPQLMQGHQVNIFCANVADEALKVASKISNIDIQIFDSKQMSAWEEFENFQEQNDIIFKNDKKSNLRDFFALFLNERNAKSYLFCALILLISTLVIRQKIYYYIFISFLLSLALICKLLPKFVSNKKI